MESAPTESSTGRCPCDEAAWDHVKGVPCRLSVEVPIPGFTVRMLMDLAPGVILDTHHEEGSHVPVLVNGQMIGWGEFDVVNESLDVRLTEMI